MMERAPQPVREMLALLRESGHAPYLVGGCVRDLLRGAAFDVFATDPAPLPKDSPLLTLDNFSATPHIGGNTQEALYRTGMAVVQNVLDVLDGKPVSSMII